MKAFIKGIPIIGPFLVHLRRGSDDFKSSSYYWDRRYKTGGNSGAGSYGRLAELNTAAGTVRNLSWRDTRTIRAWMSRQRPWKCAAASSQTTHRSGFCNWMP
jgi:hypothetical protein